MGEWYDLITFVVVVVMFIVFVRFTYGPPPRP